MKNIIYILISLVLLTSSLFPQKKDSLIQLYYGMGDTIDVIDREIFDLYQDIDEYKYAQLFIRDKKNLVSKITYLNSDILSDTVLIDDISKYSELNYNLNRFNIENDQKFESPLDASVFTKTGNTYDGKLEMFSKKYLYLNSDFNYSTGSTSPFKFKASVSNVDSLMLPLKPSVLTYVGYGALGGLGIGLVAGIATFKDDMGASKEVKWLATSAIGAGIGLLLGWLIGESIPPDIITIKFNSPYDVSKLRDHTAYYYGYDKSMEEKYVKFE